MSSSDEREKRCKSEQQAGYPSFEDVKQESDHPTVSDALLTNDKQDDKNVGIESADNFESEMLPYYWYGKV